MTSFTPKSAMTSFTDDLLVAVSLAAQGARRATGAVKEIAGQSSSEPIIMFVNNDLIHGDAEFLSSHIDSRDHIFVNNFWRHPELLPKDIQHGVATDEAHQMIAAALWLRQRMCWGYRRFRKPDLCLPESHLRRASLQLGVAIASVMFCFKDQRLLIKFLRSLHQHPAQEATAIVIVKLFHNAVAPGLGHRNKPKLYALGQAKANQTPHSAWVSMAAIDNQFIIYLLMLWYSQTPPVSPDSVDRRLRGFIKDRRHGTAPSGYVHAVHAVETQRPAQVTGTHIVALVYLIGLLAHQLWIALALRLISSSASMRQPFATDYPANCSQAWQRRNLQRLQLPTDGLRPAEQTLVVERQTHQLDCFDHRARQLSRVAMRASGLLFLPIVCFASGFIALNPLVNPRPRAAQLLGDCRYRFAFQVRFNRMFSVALLLLHTFLLNEKGPNDETTALQPTDKLVFQRTVNDVTAHRRVNDVMTLVN